MLLAMPAIWLAWAMVAFCVAILSYVWRTGSSDDPADGTRPPLSPGQAVAVRTVITAVFALGLIYFVMIVRTFASWGERETGWRRSWLATGHPGAGHRARERRRQEEERERERGRRPERERGRAGQLEREEPQVQRESVQDADEKQSPVTGLGLLGVSGSGVNGLASMSSVLAEDAEPDKGDKRQNLYQMDDMKGQGKISPKL